MHPKIRGQLDSHPIIELWLEKVMGDFRGRDGEEIRKKVAGGETDEV